MNGNQDDYAVAGWNLREAISHLKQHETKEAVARALLAVEQLLSVSASQLDDEEKNHLLALLLDAMQYLDPQSWKRHLKIVESRQKRMARKRAEHLKERIDKKEDAIIQGKSRSAPISSRVAATIYALGTQSNLVKSDPAWNSKRAMTRTLAKGWEIPDRNNPGKTKRVEPMHEGTVRSNLKRSVKKLSPGSKTPK